MSVEIRQAVAADAAGVLDAYDWLFAPPGQKPPDYDEAAARERLLEAIRSERAAVIVADDDGTIVGLAAVYLTYDSIRFGQRAWVEDLAVDPERRSQGIGARLLDAAKAWAAGAGAVILGLESAEPRADAHRFYEREQPYWRSNAYGWPLA